MSEPFKKPNHLGNLVDRTSSVFSELNKQQKHIVALNVDVQAIVKAHASMDVSVAHIETTTLTLAAESQTAANHLHYLTPILLPELQKNPQLAHIERVNVIVIDLPQKFVAVKKAPPKIPDESKDLLKKTAGIIRDNPDLSYALHQLSIKK